uniref:uncharacterized protein LOC100184466 isoform X1 n=1 Tax=Ciona intestinalis TaxID=7719 RepID=UPI000EF4BF25|nr:uncharacterized protein LOC100184466 isoform X1 [Ciona intestinalis]|eukprot:XP_026690293.1 uncharacterized protein LOC100184466 isoform X1 [Ciona intestinalis]
MTSTVAIPQFFGNYPGVIPGSVPGGIPCPIPGTMPPANVPIPTSANGVSYPTVPIQVPIQLPVVPVGGGCYNDGMEVVWHGEFSRLFCNFYPPHVWYLTITNQAPQQKWKFHRDSAKVRFCCQDCGNGWTSMKGRVTFWFYLNYLTNEGFVQFKLYGQQCKKCNSGKFEYVMWYPEEVSKVMCNVYNKVGQTYYGFLQPPIRIDRRPGRPRNQHNAELCQACRDGECDQARPIKTMFNGIIPSPLPNPPPNGALSPSLTPPEALGNPPAPTISIHQSVPTCDVSTVGSNNTVMTSPPAQTTPMQPILTYSVVTCPPKPLSATSNHFIPQNGISPPVSYVYHHPSQFPMLNGGPPPPPVMLPPPRQLMQPLMKPTTDPNTTNGVESVAESTQQVVPVEEATIVELEQCFKENVQIEEKTEIKKSDQTSSALYGRMPTYDGVWWQCMTLKAGGFTCSNYGKPSIFLSADIQAMRALMCIATIASFLAMVCSLLSLDCTTALEANTKPKNIITMVSGVFHIVAGLMCGGAVSWYAWRVTYEFYSPFYQEREFVYEFGSCLYIGWVSSAIGTCTLISTIWFAVGVQQQFHDPMYKNSNFKYEFGSCLYIGWICGAITLLAGLVLICGACKKNKDEDEHSSYPYTYQPSKVTKETKTEYV